MLVRPMSRFIGLLSLAAIFTIFPPALLSQQPPATSAASQSTLKPETEQLLKEGEADLNDKHAGDAARKFKQALKRENDKCARCYFDLAAAQDMDHDSKAAINSCDKGIAIADSDLERAEGHGTKGNLLLSLHDSNNLPQAEAELRAAIQLNPQRAGYHALLALAMMRQSKDAEGREEFATYLKMAPTGKYATFAQRLQQNPRRAREEFLPDFEVTTIKGQKVSSSDLLGKVVVIDFWATWCPPCRASVGEIKELTRKYPSDKVIVLSVSADSDDAQWRSFVEKKGMDWLQYRDADKHVLNTMGIHAFPTYIVVDREGIIRDRIVGENPQQSIVGRLKDELQKMIPPG